MSASGNLIHQTTTSTGTGNLTLVAEDGKRDFSDEWSIGGSDVFWYFISHRDAAEWEVGTGSMSDAATLVRDTVIASSNADAAVNFSAGTKDVTSDIAYASQYFAGGTDVAVADGGTGSSTAAGARTNLDVDQAGTDNSTDVTLAGSLDYLTLSGQEITRAAIDLTTDVTGDLPVAEGGTGASNAAGAKTNLGFMTDVVDDTTPQLGGDLDPNGNDWAGVLTPEADNTRDLGSSSRRWNDLYLGGNLYIGGTGAANALDDYEEGTWTPAIQGGGSNPTVTYFAQNGRYTKTGRNVVATFGIAINSYSGGSGELRVTLPFTEAGVTGATGTAYLSGANFNNAADYLIGGAPIGGAYAVFYEITDAAAIATMDVGDVGTGDVIGCTVSYEV